MASTQNLDNIRTNKYSCDIVKKTVTIDSTSVYIVLTCRHAFLTDFPANITVGNLDVYFVVTKSNKCCEPARGTGACFHANL